MGRYDIPSTYLNRPVSRRLYRCFPASALYSSQPVLSEVWPAYFSRNPSGLSDGSESGDIASELLQAKERIAELERALEVSRSAASVDPLTGALNRRGFDRVYVREMARSRRNGCGLALAMIDLDNFKQLNDHYGHSAGDKTLVHFVHVLKKTMRPSDVLCRFGGEEFVLMMPDTVAENACKAVQRFQSELSSRAVPCVGCSTTFSAGVVEHDYFESLDEAIQRADAAVYEAKRAGKNRVIVA